MKTSKFLTAALLFISAAGLARANLGDTEAQCIAKYGPESEVREPVGYRQVGDKAASFQLTTKTGSLDLRIIFLNGFSCHETYANSDSSHGLSLGQMKAILDAQSAGLEWRKGRSVYRTGNIGGDTYGSVGWRRSDGATARFWITGKASAQTQTGQVEISTKQYADAQHIYDKENGDN